jgi:flagellar protein FliO/FliZ
MNDNPKESALHKSKLTSLRLGRKLLPAAGRGSLSIVFLVFAAAAQANTTNVLSSQFASPSFPDTGPSLLRVLGAFSLVLGLFLAGVWLVRNGRLANFGRGRGARLRVVESRSLGARQALYVVAYGQEQFLIGSTPAGINLVSHLSSPADPEEPVASAVPAMSFPVALAQVLRGEKPSPTKSGGSK